MQDGAALEKKVPVTFNRHLPLQDPTIAFLAVGFPKGNKIIFPFTRLKRERIHVIM